MLNQVQLIGFTGAEPEIRTAQGGKTYAALRVATSRFTKKGNEKIDYTTWHTIEIWTPATVRWLAAKSLAKGSKVFVQGEIRNDRYQDKNDQDRYFSKVVVATSGHDLKVLDRSEHNSGV